MSTPTITFTRVFGLDALSLYKAENRFSSKHLLLPKIFPVLFVLWQLILKNYLKMTYADKHFL